MRAEGLENDELIVAVDPGGTYGVAYAYVGPGRSRAAMGLEAAPMAALRLIENALDRTQLVVCESFIPRPGVRTWQPEALEGIGALRYLADRAGVPFELQSPADAKRFSTNAKLDRLGWRRPTKGGHHDDAMRHLLLGAVRHGLIDAGVFV